MKKEYVFIGVFGALFLAMAVVFLFLPRSTFSQLERRELMTFPEFSADSLSSGSFTRRVSQWFSDSEPFRDQFMSVSMQFKDLLAMNLLNGEEDQVTFIGQDNDGGDDFIPGKNDEPALPDQRSVEDFQGEVADEVSHSAKAGILIVGKEPNARALLNYGGSEKIGGEYARVANDFKKALGEEVNIYCMVIPTAIEYYCPPKIREQSGRVRPQAPTIRYIYSQLDPEVKAVDVHSALGKHYKEDIYLRTDHHWSALGGFYAAEALAKVAGVPFRPIEDYNKNVVKRFVGTMFGYSKDQAIKNSPEDFVYFTPKDSSYVTTVIQMKLDKDFNVVGESKPYKTSYFHKFKDGSSGAYCTFMGSDALIVKVETGMKNGRKVVIMKDSFGNAVPSNLFGSFEEVHVIDFRYFPKSIRKYVRDNGITDVVFCNNIFNCVSGSVAGKYRKMLN